MIHDRKIKPGLRPVITAQEAAAQYGLSAKSILNRSSLPAWHDLYIPSIPKSDRRKRFRREDIVKAYNLHGVTPRILEPAT